MCSMRAVVGMGSNLGDRHATLRGAAQAVDGLAEARLTGRSRLYETPPVGPPQPHYLNAALAIAWDGTGPALLDALLDIEQQFGRVRRERWGARTLDLDVLWWDAPPLTSERLTVPHPHLTERAFALAPLLDAAPDLAPRFGAALLRQGGAPPLAKPGW